MSPHLYCVSTDLVKYSIALSTRTRYRLENKCSLCGLSTVIPTHTQEYERVVYPCKKWPDSLETYSAFHAYSENVVSSLHREEITRFYTRRLSFQDVPLSKSPDKCFYMFLPETIVHYTVKRNEYTDPFICSQCGRFDSLSFSKKYYGTGISSEYEMRYSDYNGEAFILAQYGDSDSFIMCSDRVIDLCRTEKWTNFVFRDHSRIKKGIRIKHELSNWRELLEQDIAKEEARLRGENSDPIQISVPAMPPRKTSPKPSSDHPFDNLSEFDGTAWQGTDSLPWAFGLYDFIVYEDENAESEVENEDDDLPTKGQRALFDYFRSIQEALLPQLYDVLMKGLQKIGILFTARIASYADLAQVLDSGDLEIRNTSPRGKGILSLGYSTKDKKHDLIVRIACTPSRKLFRVLSCRGE